jgi:MoaA/NifB/PqqE/SkfB family radical SAM enzyme
MTKILKLTKKLGEKFIEGNLNLLKIKRGQHLKPKRIWIELTDKCNSHCQHCHIWQKKSTTEQLTIEELRKIFSDPLMSDIEAIINSGGEMFLRNDILEIMKLEHEFFPKAILNISTNGILADKALAVIEELLKEGIKINPCVSIDGIGEAHDRVRGTSGNFEKADYLLHRLVELRKKYPDKMLIAVGFTLSDLTINDWDLVKNYAAKLDVEFITQWYNQSSFYENDQKASSSNRMVEIVKQQPNTIIREKWLKLLKGQPIKFRCFAAETFFALRCDGGVVPCLSLWGDTLGNIRNDDLSKIWYSVQADKVRKKIASCPGCLNTWGVEWSISATFYPRLMFYLRNLSAILERLKRRD